MNWKLIAKDGLPPDNDDTLYVTSLVNLHTRATRVGNTYLTGKQIRKKLEGRAWMWEIYAYDEWEPLKPAPLP